LFEAEILTLRQQINVLRRTAPKKQTFSAIDGLIFVWVDCTTSMSGFDLRQAQDFNADADFDSG
jgi:hypothetical protein